jgi:predicted nucleic acid-binding protein
MSYLLDTSALLAHCRNEKGSGWVQELFDAENEEILLCSVSLPEITRRLRELGAGERAISDLVKVYKELVDEIVPVDEQIAERSDDIIRASTARLPLVDALIASAARSRDAVLVHRDSHMRAIPAKLVRQLDLDTEHSPAL